MSWCISQEKQVGFEFAFKTNSFIVSGAFLNKILLAIFITILKRECQIFSLLLIILKINHCWSWGELRYIKNVFCA